MCRFSILVFLGAMFVECGSATNSSMFSEYSRSRLLKSNGEDIPRRPRPSNRHVYRGEFPLTANFRSGPRNDVKNYLKWEEKQFGFETYHNDKDKDKDLEEDSTVEEGMVGSESSGVPVDLQTNVLRFSPHNFAYANRFAREHPETLVLTTWRAASGNPAGLDASGNGDPLGESVFTFPGHFVLRAPGTHLQADLAAGDVTMVFDTNGGTSGKQQLPLERGPALLVEEVVDGATGERSKDWTRFEYVLITKVEMEIDATGAQPHGLATLRRSFNGSPPARAFPAGTTYVANLPWDTRVRSDYTDWFFNYAPNCPRDALGRTASDVLASYLVEPLRQGVDADADDAQAPLHRIGGIDLASGPLTFVPGEPHDQRVDYNADGQPDPPSEYWEGVDQLYRRIVEVSETVLSGELHFRHLPYVDGPNLEGLARPGDAWREVSRTVNRLLAWKTLMPDPDRFLGLAFVQYLMKDEEAIRVDLHRLLNGYATCLGLAADVDRGDGALQVLERDELYKGAERVPRWLGKPTGPIVRPALSTPDLLRTDTSQQQQHGDELWPLHRLRVKRADLTVDSNTGELVVTPHDDIRAGYVTLYLTFELPDATSPTDLTIYMEALSERDDNDNSHDDDDDPYAMREILLPRINVPVTTGPVRAELSHRAYLPISWYLRGARHRPSTSGTSPPPPPVVFDLRFGTGGPIRIRRLSVHAATDALACPFQRGVVLVNPSLEPIHLNLPQLFGNGHSYRRLRASTVDPNELDEVTRPQHTLALEQNDGSPVRNPHRVPIRGRNALFLSQSSSSSSSSTVFIDIHSEMSSLLLDTATTTSTATATAATLFDPTAEATTPASHPLLYEAAPSPEEVPNPSSATTTVAGVAPCADDYTQWMLLNDGTEKKVNCWYVSLTLTDKTRKERCRARTTDNAKVEDICPKTCDKCGKGRQRQRRRDGGKLLRRRA